MLISPQSATVLTTTLTEAGYVEHAASRTDGRRKIVALTKKAERILEKLSRAHLHEIRDMAPELMDALGILQDRRKTGIDRVDELRVLDLEEPYSL